MDLHLYTSHKGKLCKNIQHYKTNIDIFLQSQTD